MPWCSKNRSRGRSRHGSSHDLLPDDLPGPVLSLDLRRNNLVRGVDVSLRTPDIPRELIEDFSRETWCAHAWAGEVDVLEISPSYRVDGVYVD